MPVILFFAWGSGVLLLYFLYDTRIYVISNKQKRLLITQTPLGKRSLSLSTVRLFESTLLSVERKIRFL